jgi:polygalacturonase
MCIVENSAENRWNGAETCESVRVGKRQAIRRRRIGLKWFTGVAALAPAIFACKPVFAGNPNDYTITLPSIGATDYNVTVSNPLIDGGAVANPDGTSFNNTTVLNDFLSYAASHGGGTVELPSNANAYGSGELFVGNNVNLQIDSGATLQNLLPKDSFLSTISGTNHDVEVSGGGIINDNATSSASNHMCTLENINHLTVSNVTIENSSEEHLVAENDVNALINNVTIQDSKVIANTDGIDFSGSHFLIENCNISDDDDDIVAKPQTVFCSDIYITNDTITNGHGISIGGNTVAGLNGMYVNNITENMASAPNAVGIHLKAGDGTSSATQNGGPVRNVTFNNITMNNVDDGIDVDSYYNNGGSNLPTIPAPVAPTDSTEPIWNDITFENINIGITTSNSGIVYGLNSTPANMDAMNFLNITATAAQDPWKMYYADDVFMNNVNIDGSSLLNAIGTYKNSSGDQQAEEADDTFDNSANAIYTVDMPTLVQVPEPGSLTLIGAVGLSLLPRRFRRRRSR